MFLLLREGHFFLQIIDFWVYTDYFLADLDSFRALAVLLLFAPFRFIFVALGFVNGSFGLENLGVVVLF